MSFTITKKKFGNHSLYELADLVSETTVGIIPTCGASLNNFLVRSNNKVVDVVNGYKSSDDLDENLTNNFKGVILSPFANRINKASYNFNNSNFVLDKVWKDKDFALHGYLYNQLFKTVSETTTDDNATLILKNRYEGTLPGFPFPYETTVVYILQENNQLSCKTIIQNIGKEDMPISFGWHPVFFNDVNINDLELEFPALYKVEVDEDYIPTGNKIPYTSFNKRKKIDDTFFDYCFKLSEGGTSAQVKLYERSNRINVEINIETGKNKFQYLQIYIPPDRNMIALEPMSSWPDAFNNHQDLLILQPNEFIEFNYDIKVSAFNLRLVIK